MVFFFFFFRHEKELLKGEHFSNFTHHISHASFLKQNELLNNNNPYISFIFHFFRYVFFFLSCFYDVHTLHTSTYIFIYIENKAVVSEKEKLKRVREDEKEKHNKKKRKSKENARVSERVKRKENVIDFLNVIFPHTISRAFLMYKE